MPALRPLGVACLAAVAAAGAAPRSWADSTFQQADGEEAQSPGDRDLEADIRIELHRPQTIREEASGLRGAAALIAGDDALGALERAWSELLEGLGVADAWAEGELLAGPLTIAIDRADPRADARAEMQDGEPAAGWRWVAVAPLHKGAVRTIRGKMRGKVRGSVEGRARFSMEDGRYQTAGVRAEDGTPALIVASAGARAGDLFARAVRWADDRRDFGRTADGSRITLRVRTEHGPLRLIAAERDERDERGGEWVARLIGPAEALGLRSALEHTWTGSEAEARLGGDRAAFSMVGSVDLLTGLLGVPSLLRRGDGGDAAAPDADALGLESGRFACVLRPAGDALALSFRGESARDGRSRADAAAGVVLRTLGADAGASRLAGRMPEVVRRQCVELEAGSLAHAALGPKAVLRWGAVEQGRGEADDGSSWWAIAAHPAGGSGLESAFRGDRHRGDGPGDGPGERPGDGPGFVRAAAGERAPARRVLSMGVYRPGLMPEGVGGWLGIDPDGLLGAGGSVSWEITADDRARVRAEIVIEPGPGAHPAGDDRP